MPADKASKPAKAFGKTITLQVPDDLNRRIQLWAAATGQPKYKVIVDALSQGLRVPTREEIAQYLAEKEEQPR